MYDSRWPNWNKRASSVDIVTGGQRAATMGHLLCLTRRFSVDSEQVHLNRKGLRLRLPGDRAYMSGL